VFWTVTGDVVTAMALADVDGDGRNELLVSGLVAAQLVVSVAVQLVVGAGVRDGHQLCGGRRLSARLHKCGLCITLCSPHPHLPAPPHRRPNPNHPQLKVGCDDFEIRVFKDEDLILQITEADQITGLASLGGARFAYALRNGTIGAYEGSGRLWRVKSKHGVMGVTGFDLNGDGAEELLSGWSNGRVSGGGAGGAWGALGLIEGGLRRGSVD